MDGSAFDRLVRRISEEGTRRGLLRSALAAVAGIGAGPYFGAEVAAAKSCKKKCYNQKNCNDKQGSAKQKCKQKCKKKCKNTDTDTIGLRQPCTKSSQCVGDLLCATANSQNSCPGQETGTFCCVQTDVQAPCDDGCDCCGSDVICNGGYCQSA